MDWSEKSIIIVVQSGSWNRDFFLTCGLFLSRTHTHTVPSHIFFYSFCLYAVRSHISVDFEMFNSKDQHRFLFGGNDFSVTTFYLTCFVVLVSINL